MSLATGGSLAATKVVLGCYLDKDGTGRGGGCGRRQRCLRQTADGVQSGARELDEAPGRAVRDRVVHCCLVMESVRLGGHGH